MPARIECSNCKQVFEDEGILNAPRDSDTNQASSRSEVVVFCPFCEKPTRVKVPESRLVYHYIDRGAE